ncbi:putative enoyl-CoA hydratase/isomerase family protein [Hypoxylon trugodes]|uniref:putative enoyl-CoA hydratase/isomerase family protein n=1 Tax=Hypoxylon trugodes TaxID=326681 RepID=UPI00218D39A2|nr:putative enoyl-CoA hydratase/isomerase family protein [Hypoxylon trugodes]KAI1390799.1 putative enoyl-CoA hydratase/isomerase family protein [Hypoxylon trugodes]
MEKTFIVPCPPFDVKLSHWDRHFPPTHSKRILCFSLPPDADKQSLVGYLKTAFHNTIQRIPFLAGSVVPFSEDEGNRPWLRNIIPEGAARLVFKDLSDSLNFDELSRSNFSQHLLNTEQLCPLPGISYVQDDPVDVCRFQANFITGGLLLTVSIIHIAADGRGVTEVTKIFAEELRKAQVVEPLFNFKTRETTYQSDRTALVTGNGVRGDIEKHAAWTSSTANAHSQLVDVDDSCRTFRISAKSLLRLKKAASEPSSGPGDWISTNDAITALIWRSIMAARLRAGILTTDSKTSITQPVDCRSHLHLPEPYFGNVLYFTKTSIPFSILTNPKNGLGSAARLIRAELKNVTAETFRDLVGYSERTSQEAHTRLNIIEDVLTEGLILTSHFKFALHELNFGPAFGDGYMKALRLPAKGTMAGSVIVMPKLPDGSCEFMVSERESVINFLAEDEFFSQFIKEEDDTSSIHSERTLASSPQPIVPPKSEKLASFVSHASQTALSTPKGREDVKVPTLVVSNIKASQVGTIRVIQLQRPKAKNALSKQMVQELSQEIEAIHHERGSGGTRVLVISSAVEGVFCSGADLKERKNMNPIETRDFLTSLRTLFTRLESLPIPTIACVSGVALGGGLELALCCHLRVFSSDAVVGLPETRLGIIPGAGGTYRLPKVVGRSHALDMILTGRRVQAYEAASMGLCDRLVAADGLGNSISREMKQGLALATGISLAQEISSGGPIAIRAAISALAYGCETMENSTYELTLNTKDRLEALQAFGEKRHPIFVGE